MLQKTLLVFFISLLMMQCSSKETKDKKDDSVTSSIAAKQVYNYSNKAEFAAFQALKLDETHANLLNPNVSKDAKEEVMNEWVQLHTDIGSFLAKNDFKWNSNDSTIKVFHKVYFDTTGHIKQHFINVLTASVNEATKEKFAQLMEQFVANYKINLKRDRPFAQCGPARYLN